jgi:hypothetical protein
MRGTARGFEGEPNTVLGWCVDATDPPQALACYCLHALPLTQGPLDELYAVRRALKDGKVSAGEAHARLSRSPQGGWTAMDPPSKLLLAIAVGARPRALAPGVGQQVAQRLAPDGVPLCLPDGCKASMTALLTH